MILIVDDEERYMEGYLEELQQTGHAYSFQTNVDAALKFFKENLDQIRLLILDIMMPPGNSFGHEETQMGLITGTFFYEEVRRIAPDLPIIILTNVADEKPLASIIEQENCWFYQKPRVLPFELVEIIEALLPKSSSEEKEGSQ